MSTSARRAIVVGAGIGGLGAAIGLQQAGWEVTVLERAAALKAAGAGLAIWPNGSAALEALGLARELEAISEPSRGGLNDPAGRPIIPIDQERVRRIHGRPALMLHRADLQQILLHRLAAGTVRLGAEVVAVQHDGGASGIRGNGAADGGGDDSSRRGRVKRTRRNDQIRQNEPPPRSAQVLQADGAVHTAELLIGADGLRSSVRAHVLGGRQPLRHLGHTSWRAVVDVTNAERGQLPWGEFWGPGGVFGLILLPGNRVYWYGTRPSGRASGTGTAYDPGLVAAPGNNPETLAQLSRHFGAWNRQFRLVVDRTDPAALLELDLYDRNPSSRWSRGHVTLLGDAAHPMAPFLGQGACQALEDAVALARVMAPHNAGLDTAMGSAARAAARDDISWRLAEYERLRRRRAATMVRRSRHMGALAQLSNPAARTVRNFCLRCSPAAVRNRSLDLLIRAR